MEILIISGLSGSGKSRAAAFLEDAGYYTVDNLPAEMMLRFADFCAAAGGRYDKLAFVYDVRAGEPSTNLTDAVAQLRARGIRCRLLFLEADTPTIIRRYKETRRSHPLCSDGCSIESAVSRERSCSALSARLPMWCWIPPPFPPPSSAAPCCLSSPRRRKGRCT